MFTVLVFLGVIINVACGVLSYSLYSGGAILQELYDYLASHDLSFFVWAAAGVGLLGTIVTLIAYTISFDYRRAGRPIIRVWILLASFALFLAGLILGAVDVPPDNVPLILGAGLLCLVFPLPILYIERSIGRGALRSAKKLLEGHSPTSARASARTALVLLPGKPETLTTYGLALSMAGKNEQALPYLVYAEKHQPELDNRTRLALADAWDATGDPARTIHYLETLPADAAPGLRERLVRLWLDNHHEDRALEAISAMTPQDRKPWRAELQVLLTERRDREGLHRLCAEVRADDEAPYDNSVACYKQLLDLYPTDSQALAELVDIQKDLKQPDTVAALQEELLRLNEDQPETRRELINYYWERGHREDLLRHLNRIMLAGQATTAEKLRLLEETYAEGDYLRVEQLLGQEEDLGNNPRALFILASTLADAGREDAALERIAQARRLGPDDRLLKNLDGLAARIRKLQLDKGLSNLEERVTTSPGDLDLKFDYLDHLVAARSADRVVVQLDDLLETQPELQERVEKEIRVMLSRHGKNRRLMDFLGDLYLRSHEYDIAFELFERRAQGEMDAADILHEAAQKILALNPTHQPSLEAEMRYHHAAGNAVAALGFLDRLPTERAREADQRRLELDAAKATGDSLRAISAGHALLELTPEDTALLSQIAALHTEAQQYPEAIDLLQKATQLDPESYELRRQLRGTVEAMKRRRMEEVQAGLAAEPRNRDLLEEAGDLYHDFEDLNSAIAAYQRAGLNDPERRIPRAKLGYLLAKKGLFTDADEALQEADLNPALEQNEQDQLKNLFFITAQLMEEEAEEARALNLYRRIFRVDAGYRDVVTHIERLQSAAKKRESGKSY
jgi:tetratricopeptide (TPR) repeat protein